jgi:carbamoyltransferase
MNILGLSAYYHDASACLMRDGQVVAAVHEERFSRARFDADLPRASVRYCLQAGGIGIDEVDIVAYYENPRTKLGRQIWASLPAFPSRDPAALYKLDAARPEREIRELLGYEGEIYWSTHHLSHAASAYYFSGFAESAVLTVDGVGEWQTTTYGVGRGRDLEIFDSVDYPDSLGLLYAALTDYLGFAVNSDEYKVMGLAAYGKATLADKVSAMVEVGPAGQYRLNPAFFDFTRPDSMFTDAVVEHFGCPKRVPESEIETFHEDLAASLQTVLEEVLLDKAAYLHERTGSSRLCFAGGVALNVVANARILRDGPFEELFVQPAAGDAGTALGAAALAHLAHSEQPVTPLAHVYLGPSYDSDITDVLGAGDAVFQSFDDEDELCREVAGRLAAGEVVGWFQGRMEFGPRALGARSILADPRGEGTRDRINALVKMRESFRPFAPAVLHDRVAEHFELDRPSPYMLETCKVISPIPMPAITHVDATARVQTVHEETNPRFWKLIRAFDDITGCPIVLNTSFNLRGEPIVCTPPQALLCFIRSNMDALVLGNHVLTRSGLPATWIDWFAGTRPEPSSAISETVYTFL